MEILDEELARQPEEDGLHINNQARFWIWMFALMCGLAGLLFLFSVIMVFFILVDSYNPNPTPFFLFCLYLGFAAFQFFMAFRRLRQFRLHQDKAQLAKGMRHYSYFWLGTLLMGVLLVFVSS